MDWLRNGLLAASNKQSAVDPMTVSLLHFDGNGNDAIPARTWTNNGVTFGTAGVFGNQASFNGSSYMECTDPEMAIGVNEEFTIQGWFTPVPPGNTTQIAFGIGSGVGSDYITMYHNSGQVFLASYGVWNDGLAGWTINTPFFFAMVGRADGTYDVYVNTIRRLTGKSRQGASTSARLELGRGFWNQASKWNGQIDEFKFSKKAEYIGATITVPSAPFSS